MLTLNLTFTLVHVRMCRICEIIAILEADRGITYPIWKFKASFAYTPNLLR